MKNLFKAPLMGLAILLSLASYAQEPASWPQEISGKEGTLVIYQPQPESLDGDKLSARSAISIELPGEEPVFGAMWFESRISTDKDAGTARVLDISVTKAGWPDSKDAGEQRLTQVVENAFPDHGFEISLERLTASLETADIERESLENLNNEPPEIVFARTLSVLLMFDGDPRFEKVENSPYERALNTPFLAVREGRKKHYLSDGTHWYQASDPLGPWSVTTSPPKDLVEAIEASSEEKPAKNPGPAPAIVAATEPTELIVTDGDPNWQSITGGEILYVQNTETPWLRYLPSGNMYLLLSGRWYRSKSEGGPWIFVPPTELPPAFAEIPPASDIGGLRSSIAGTEEAEQAMLDASIPQTAAISRSETKLEVTYDGKPKFEQIKGTEVAYAVNTGEQVIKVKDHYYAVNDGVWFESASPTGPWKVADTVPEDEIAKIPPTAPVYNLTYVHVYESTPEVVYVGYTPGYMWSFPYYGVPYYGTGWYYPPYWGGIYYPRPPTWGFHVGYNPWTGWNFGVSWSNGFFSFGVAWGGGWGYNPWGCCRGGYHRGPTFINTGDINIGNNVNIGNHLGDNNLNLGDRGGRDNLYNRPENRDRLASRDQRESLQKARPANNRANNVFADSKGNIARRTNDGWETRNNGQWNKPATKDLSRETVNSTRPSTNRDFGSNSSFGSGGFNHNEFNRAHSARSMGASREMRRPSRAGGRRRR